MLRTSSVLVLLFCCLRVIAQPYSVNGRVIDRTTSKPIVGTVLAIMQKDSLLSKFVTDIDGRFSFPLHLYEKASYIQLTSTSYNSFRFVKEKETSPTRKNIFLKDFMLDATGIDLGEVIIRHKRRYRDTTSIDMKGKIFERNIMVDDLFSSSGFSKDASGTLYYKGKQVGEVLVNGQTFFGRNNMEVYKNLPALTIDHITITETDIDSMTNITLLKPAIKINLNLKEKYSKGFFGSAAAGAGSAYKYLTTGEISAYKKNRQLSFEAGSNNTNTASGPFFEPFISFSPDGSRTEFTRVRATYRDLYFKNRLEVNVLVSAKDVQRKMESISEQRDGALDQNSRTVNNNRSHSHMLDAANLSLALKIDSLNSIKASLITEFNRTSNTDSLNYRIDNGNSTNFSAVNKMRRTFYGNTVSDINYHHSSSVRKGRSINLGLHVENHFTDVNEEGMVSDILERDEQKYTISGIRNGTESITSLNWSFIEPLSQDTYLKILSSYRRERLSYLETQLMNVASQPNNADVVLVNDHAKIGLNVRKTGKKITFDANVIAMLSRRFNKTAGSMQNFNTIDADLSVEYKIVSKRFISARIQRSTNYPVLAQLTGINSSYDRISQTLGNPLLSPEIRNHFDVNYDLYKSDSLSLGVYGSGDLYQDKFGMNISAGLGRPQLSYIDNLGKVANAQLGFAAAGNFSGFSLSSRTSLSYQGFLSIFNQNILEGKSVGINQSFSANATALKKRLSFQPTLSVSYIRNGYGDQASNQYSLTYLDKVGFSWGKYELALYPMTNFNFNLSRNLSFAANTAVKKNIFKGMGQVWIQAYDIFNSFRFINNVNSGTYIRSVYYSNQQRYFLVGCSIKFNSMGQ